ncbi:MAG: DUF2225 domain-containing protein [Nanoarchaeota archaeon]
MALESVLDRVYQAGKNLGAFAKRGIMYAVTTAVLAGSSVPANGTTSVTEIEQCPICSTDVETTSIISTSIHGQGTDLRPFYFGDNVLDSMYACCPECKICLYTSDFSEPSEDVQKNLEALRAALPIIQAVSEELEKKSKYGLGSSDKVVITELCYTAAGKDDDFFGDFYTRASWVSGKELGDEFRDKAISRLMATYTEESDWSVPYLIGEFNRRLGNYDDAMVWFGISKMHIEKEQELPDWDPYEHGLSWDNISCGTDAKEQLALTGKQEIEVLFRDADDDKLISMLENELDNIRLVAAEHLSDKYQNVGIGRNEYKKPEVPRQVMDALIQPALHDPNIEIREKAMRFLRSHADSTCFDVFVQGLDDEYYGIVQSSVLGLGELKDPRATELLIKEYQKQNYYTLNFVLDALYSLGMPESLEFFHSIRKQEKLDRDTLLDWHSANYVYKNKLFWEYYDESSEKLIPLLEDEDPIVRLAAIDQLVDRDEPGLCDIITDFLEEEPESVVREQVSNQLSYCGTSDDCRIRIARLFLGDSEKNIQRDAIDAIYLESNEVEDVVSLLEEQFYKDPEICSTVLFYLMEIGTEESLSALRRAMTDPREDIRPCMQDFVQYIIEQGIFGQIQHFRMRFD